MLVPVTHFISFFDCCSERHHVSTLRVTIKHTCSADEGEWEALPVLMKSACSITNVSFESQVADGCRDVSTRTSTRTDRLEALKEFRAAQAHPTHLYITDQRDDLLVGVRR